MILAIWTKSPPKVRAIEEGARKCLYFSWEEITIISEKVESWVSDMPLSLEEDIAWAKNRALNIKALLESQWKIADFYIGMEWGTNLIWDQAYLFWAVHIINTQWEEHLWLSNFLQLPAIFQEKIYKQWLELWPILQEITWEKWAAQKWGSFNHWTDWQLTRKDQFMLAFTWAISPFYNKYYKL